MFRCFDFVIAFYYYKDSLFEVSIHLTHKRFSKVDNNIITRKEELIDLKAPFNSSILSKTLEEGSRIKQLNFFNTKHYKDYVIKCPVFHIFFSKYTHR